METIDLEKEYKEMLDSLIDKGELSEHARLLMVGFGTRIEQFKNYDLADVSNLLPDGVCIGELSVTINKTEFPLDKPVFDLIHSISLERDACTTLEQIEKELDPEYMNTIFSWKQIEDAYAKGNCR